jgi:hypothetical protein
MAFNRELLYWASRSGAVSVVDLRYARYRAFKNANFFKKISVSGVINRKCFEKLNSYSIGLTFYNLTVKDKETSYRGFKKSII